MDNGSVCVVLKRTERLVFRSARRVFCVLELKGDCLCCCTTRMWDENGEVLVADCLTRDFSEWQGIGGCFCKRRCVLFFEAKAVSAFVWMGTVFFCKMVSCRMENGVCVSRKKKHYWCLFEKNIVCAFFEQNGFKFVE